jgi:hypothetical protein
MKNVTKCWREAATLIVLGKNNKHVIEHGFNYKVKFIAIAQYLFQLLIEFMIAGSSVQTHRKNQFYAQQRSVSWRGN